MSIRQKEKNHELGADSKQSARNRFKNKVKKNAQSVLEGDTDHIGSVVRGKKSTESIREANLNVRDDTVVPTHALGHMGKLGYNPVVTTVSWDLFPDAGKTGCERAKRVASPGTDV